MAALGPSRRRAGELPWWYAQGRAGGLPGTATIQPQPQVSELSYPKSVSSTSGTGASLADAKLQDLHNAGQQLGNWEEVR